MLSQLTSVAPAPSRAGAGCPFAARLAALSARLQQLDRGPASHLQPLSAAAQYWYDTASKEHEQDQEYQELLREQQQDNSQP